MVDSVMGTRVSLPSSEDATRDNVFKSVDDSMANFLSRPIQAASFVWTPNQVTPFGTTFNPWSAFFGNARVINRLNNYMLMRSKLHVRFMINGNGFYYGRLMADYQPLPTNDDSTAAGTATFLNAVQASQRMKVFIDPSDCCASELECPFVWYRDAISPVLAEWSQLGVVNVRELVGLKHANGATQPVTISVFIWATDVQYAVPTSVPSSALVVQAGDEYGAGPVENVATAIGGAAKVLSSLPVVGPYARATSLAASAASRMARAAGWSRPAIIEPLSGMRPTFVSSLAPADAGDNVTKLTVDSKQEVSVDPSIIGIKLGDELSIASIAARESYLTTFTWGTADTAGDLLYNLRVQPSLCRSAASIFYVPACALAEIPFEKWRGKMRFRFQVVASAYHKGRIRAVFDPSYIASLETNVQYTRIIDIAKERDITMEIDWAQTAHFLNTGSLATGVSQHGFTPIATASANANGVLGLYVLNDLATPNSQVNNDIQINVFISMVDFQAAVPRDILPYGTNFTTTVQAGEDMPSDMGVGNEPGCGPATSEHVIGNAPIDAHDADVYFGEVIGSFRQLLRRYCFDFSMAIPSAALAAPLLISGIIPNTPVPMGYNSSTFFTTTTAKKFNYVYPSVYRLLAPCFVASRGSQRVKYIAYGVDTVKPLSMNVTRGYDLGLQFPISVALNVSSASAYARSTISARRGAGKGSVFTPVAQQPVLEVELPYYKNVRFDESRIQSMANTSPTSPYAHSHALELIATRSSVLGEVVIVDRYTSVGEDFSFMWWQGCPPLTAVAYP